MILIKFHEGPKDGLVVDATPQMEYRINPPRTVEVETVFEMELLHVYELKFTTPFLDVSGQSHILHYRHLGVLFREGKELRYNGSEEV